MCALCKGEESVCVLCVRGRGMHAYMAGLEGGDIFILLLGKGEEGYLYLPR